MTPLIAAHAAMEAAPEDNAARLAFYEAFVAAELILLTAGESDGERVKPALFDTGEGRLALVFDSEERLAGLAGGAPYAAMPGRTLIALAAGKGIGLGLNFPEGPAAFLMPPEAVDWLAQVLSARPEPVAGRPEALVPPRLPDALIVALDRRLARAGGLARSALIAGARWDGGSVRPLVALVDIAPGAEPVLSAAVGEALAFSGLDAQALDLMFLSADDPLIPRLSALALAIELPSRPDRPAPGSDPARPPRLR